jgi:hypothetical protein
MEANKETMIEGLEYVRANLMGEGFAGSVDIVDSVLAHLRASPAPAAVPEGFVLVPIEPTEAMLEAVRPIYSSNERGSIESRANLYRKMIAARPYIPEVELGITAEDLGLPAQAAGGMTVPDGWQPIETAPKDGRTLLLGYLNTLGRWRTVRGEWMSDEYIAGNWEDPDNGTEGWFETCVEADTPPNCWPIEPTHWMPLPSAPDAAAPSAGNALPADSAAAPAANTEFDLRKLLALQYAGVVGLYSDDGELQDSREAPWIDFKRDAPDEIGRKMVARTTKALAAHPPAQADHSAQAQADPRHERPGHFPGPCFAADPRFEQLAKDQAKLAELVASRESREARTQAQAGEVALPEPYRVGNEYRTQEGKWVRFVGVANEGTSYESMFDEDGVHRYTRRDFGRVTGTAHDYSDPRNTPPLYGNARALAAGAGMQERDDVEEAVEILDNLMDSIQTHGNYSAESTLVFLNQVKLCLRAAIATREAGQ